jgi:C_GCAxxG_C_C family probable redox protein
VLLALAEQQGIQSDVIPKIATGFCSGFSRTAGLCGAVSGAVMGIGLALGRSAPGQSVEPAYSAIRLFLTRFESEFGSTNCQALTGCHLGTSEGQVSFKAEGRAAGCYRFAAEAARIAAEVIQEKINAQKPETD